MTDMTFESPVGASVWESDMLRHLRDHMTREGAMLEEYAFATEHTRSKALRYLIGILLDDEHRHHRWFQDLAATVQISASLTGEDTPVPDLDIHRFDPTAVDALVERLEDNEKDDARELARLRRELRDFEDTTMWTLLVELMELDTQKHLAILRFVRKHAAPLR
jgi:hypothetical protein